MWEVQRLPINRLRSYLSLLPPRTSSPMDRSPPQVDGDSISGSDWSPCLCCHGAAAQAGQSGKRPVSEPLLKPEQGVLANGKGGRVEPPWKPQQRVQTMFSCLFCRGGEGAQAGFSASTFPPKFTLYFQEDIQEHCRGTRYLPRVRKRPRLSRTML